MAITHRSDNGGEAARQPDAAGAPRTAGEPAFAVDEVSFTVGARAVLQPSTLRFSAGRVYGLIGHNGSGKSTLLKLLARQQQPTGGTIRFGGRRLQEWTHRALARKIAYLPQQTPATDGMTVSELVALGRYPWHGALGRFGARDDAKVAEAMALTDVAGFATRAVDSLSGGERQRVWLAMLVAQDSEWLLLDEPISALDIAHQIEVLSLVKHLSAARGLGVVVVLHDINMASRFCDELVALRRGQLLVSGRTPDLMRPDVLGEIYGVRMGIVSNPFDNSPITFAL